MLRAKVIRCEIDFSDNPMSACISTINKDGVHVGRLVGTGSVTQVRPWDVRGWGLD